MSIAKVLSQKKVLIVDDEIDILDTLSELLDKCVVDTASDSPTAKMLLTKNKYDAAILDIMGVEGYQLLELSKEKGIPALIFTAHALDAKHFKKSIRRGAHAYIPKEHIFDIEYYLAELILANEKRGRKGGAWYLKLKPFFDKKFGGNWRQKDKDFWGNFGQAFLSDESKMKNELTISDRILCIKEIGIFEGLSAKELAVIASIAEEQSNDPGEIIVREGDIGETLFLMIEGEVSVIKNFGTEREFEIDRMQDFDFFGEMSQLDNERRSATVKAEKPSRFLVLDRHEFFEVAREYPQVTMKVCKGISARIRRLNAVAVDSSFTKSGPQA